MRPGHEPFWSITGENTEMLGHLLNFYGRPTAKLVVLGGAAPTTAAVAIATELLSRHESKKRWPLSAIPGEAKMRECAHICCTQRTRLSAGDRPGQKCLQGDTSASISNDFYTFTVGVSSGTFFLRSASCLEGVCVGNEISQYRLSCSESSIVP